MYGEKGRIALIRPGVTPNTEMDFHTHLPKGVSLTTCGVTYDAATLEGLKRMSERVRDCAAQFRGFPMDLVCFSCTTGSMVGGEDYDKKLIQEIEEATGIRALTTTTALLAAFSALNVKKLSIVTPYSDALNRMEVDFLAKNGIETCAIRGLGLEGMTDIPFVESRKLLDMAKKQGLCGADALFISCTGISVLDIIDDCEDYFKVPCVTSNQATIWASLRAVGYEGQLEGLGKLGELQGGKE